MTTRKAINDLLPDTDYALRVRSVTGTKKSEWSPRLKFKTIDDQIQPNTPGNPTWVAVSTSFHGEWDAVTKNNLDNNISIVRYEIELVAGGMTKFKSVSPQTSTGSRVDFDLSNTANRALFGTPQATVRFRVRAVSNTGNKSDWTTPITASNAAPEPPTNFVATGVVDGISMTWDRSVSADITRYEIYVSTTSASFTPTTNLRVFSGDATAFTYPTATYVPHYFKICAVDAYGTRSIFVSATASPISPYGADTTAPSIPTGLTVTTSRTTTNSTANLSWTFDANAAGNKDIQSFVIRWRKVGSTNYFLDFVPKDARTAALTLPQAYSVYEFQIASIDSVANYSEYSNTATTDDPFPGPPGQVTGVTAKAGLDSIQLSWTAATEGDVTNGGYYKVDIAKDSAFTNSLLSYNTGNTNITVNGLSYSTTYYYRVSAVDSTAQTGPYSTVASIATAAFPTPAKSDGVAPTSSPTPVVTPGIGYLFVSWTAITNNDPVVYEIHVSLTNNFTTSSSTKVAEIAGTVATLEKDAAGNQLAYDTTYYVKLVAKDVDGPAPSSAQASGQIAKAGTNDINLSVGSLNVGSTLTIQSGGQIKSSNYNLAGGTGYSLTDSALTILNGTVSAGVLQAGSTITNNLSVGASMTISSAGTIRSTNYNDGSSGGTPAGFSLSSVGLDIRSGTVAFGTLTGGTVTASGLRIGAGGEIIVDATGTIKSNNYASGSTGWRLSSTGLEIVNGTIYANTIVGDIFTGREFVVTSGGQIRSSNFSSSSQTGWGLSQTGLEIYNGSIRGASVYTNQLASLTNDPNTGLPTFTINAGGYAQFSGAQIFGNMTLGSASQSGTQNFIQSYNYSLSQNAGWQILANGNANFNQVTVRGTVYATNGTFAGTLNGATGTFTGDLNASSFNTAQSGQRVEITTGERNAIRFYGDANNVNPGKVSVSANSGGEMTIASASNNNQGQAVIILTPGPTPGLTMRNNGSGTLPVNIQGSLTTNQSIRSGINLGADQLAGTGGNVPVYTTNDGTLTRSGPSSRRYKKEIAPLKIKVDSILSLEPVSFYYKDEKYGTQKNYGFIAEEAHELGLEPWVRYNEEGQPDSFDYIQFVVALQQTNRYQQETIERQQEQIELLQEQVQKILDEGLDKPAK